jgi:hypothetical protein
MPDLPITFGSFLSAENGAFVPILIVLSPSATDGASLAGVSRGPSIRGGGRHPIGGARVADGSAACGDVGGRA